MVTHIWITFHLRQSIRTGFKRYTSLGQGLIRKVCPWRQFDTISRATLMRLHSNRLRFHSVSSGTMMQLRLHRLFSLVLWRNNDVTAPEYIVFIHCVQKNNEAIVVVSCDVSEVIS